MKISGELKRKISGLKLVVFDFDGVFTDNKVYVNEKGEEMVVCFRGDGLGLEKLRNLGLETMILSTEVNSVVMERAKKLRIDCIYACKDKLATLTGEIRKMNLDFSRVAFVGNDENDLGCLNKVGLPIIVADSHSSLLKKFRFKTGFKGGNGAVREVCDLIYSVRSKGI